MRLASLLSVVIPCHNEQEILPDSYQILTSVLQDIQKNGMCNDYELVFVNNGSTDNTANVLDEIYRKDKHVRVVELRGNFGYQGSISAGLAHAGGDAIVTLDADLQDPPEKIKDMLLKFGEGFDLVLGVRQNRTSDSFFKRFFSENYYRLLRILDIHVVHNHGDFRLMSRSLVDEFNQLTERNRFIRAMILQLENKYAIVGYDRQARKKGKTKFNISALFSFSLDGLVSFSYAPLRIASMLGFFFCAASLCGIFWIIYIKIKTNVIPGWASTVLPIFGFGGLQLLVLGIIGEYIGRLYTEVKQRPVYIVRKEYRHND